MADTVRLDEGQNWAREATLQSLLKQSGVTNQYLGEYLKSKNIDKVTLDAIKTQTRTQHTDWNRSEQNNNTRGKKLNEALKQGLSGFSGDFGRSLESLSGHIGRIGAGPGGVLGVLQDATNIAGSSILNFGSSLSGASKFAVGLGGNFLMLSAAAVGLWHSVAETNKQYLGMYDTGLRFTNGLNGLVDAASSVGISTGELADTFTRFGSAVTFLGTNKAVQLASQFTKLNRESGNLMMTNQQAVEAFLEYTDIMRSTGQLRGMTDTQLVNKSREFYLELTQLSEVTGRQRKEIAKSIEAQVKDLDFNVALARFRPEQAEAARENIKQLQKFGPEAAKTLQSVTTSFIARGGPSGLNRAMQMVVTQSGLTGTFASLSEKLMKPGADITAEMSTIAEAMQGNRFEAAMSVMAGMGEEGAEAARQIELLRQQSILFTKVRQNEQEQEREYRAEARRRFGDEEEWHRVKKERDAETARRNQAVLETQNRFAEISNRLSLIFQKLAVNIIEPMLPVFDNFGKILEKATEAFKSLSEKFASIFGAKEVERYQRNEKGEIQYDATGKPIVEKTGQIKMEGLAASAGTIAAIATTVAGYIFGKKALLSAITGAVGAYKSFKGTGDLPLPGRLASIVGPAGTAAAGAAGTAGTAAAGPLGAASTAIQNLKGAPANIGLVMSSIAMGLRAFANPQVILGSAAIGGAIAAIGAGIAGATWLMGASLPKLSEGMKAIAEVDGERLGAVGKSMITLSGGIAALGASEVVGGFGAFINGISAMFSADPLSKLSAFAEWSTNADKLDRTSESFTKFAESYAKTVDVFQNPINADSLNNLSKLVDIVSKSNPQPGMLDKLSEVFGGAPAGATGPDTGTTGVNIIRKASTFFEESKSLDREMLTKLDQVIAHLVNLNNSTLEQTANVTRAVNRSGTVNQYQR